MASTMTRAQVGFWARVEPAILDRCLAALDRGSMARIADSLTPEQLRNIVGALSDAGLRELALVRPDVLARYASLPPDQLAKFDGIPGFQLNELAGRPDFANLAANESAATIRTEAAAGHGGDRAAAQQLDVNPNTGGPADQHGTVRHGAQTTEAQQEARVRTSQTPDSAHKPTEAAGRWASDAAQLHAEQQGRASLQAYLDANGPPAPQPHPRIPFDGSAGHPQPITYDQGSCGYSISVEGGARPAAPTPASPVTGGAAVREQVGRFIIIFEANNPAAPSTNAADYRIITMFPVY